MHVIVAIDGSRQSLAAARHLKSFADPSKISDVSIVAVIRPLAAVAFADEISGTKGEAGGDVQTFRDSAEAAMKRVAAEFDGWGPKVHQRLRSGSPANEIIKTAKQLGAGLVVVASGGRGPLDQLAGAGIFVSSKALSSGSLSPVFLSSLPTP